MQAEKAAWLKEKEEEELKKTPYEEEMALCEYLANYLTTTYLDNKTEAAAPEVEAGKKVTDDPFAGMVAVKKVDENFMKMGGKKQKKVKAKKETKPEKFNISLDAFEQYALINLTPPTAIDQVQASVDALVAKKEVRLCSEDEAP